MSPLPRLSSLLRNLFRKDRVERDLDSEVSAYLDQLVEEKISAGMAPEQARRAARIEVGGPEQVRVPIALTEGDRERGSARVLCLRSVPEVASGLCLGTDPVAAASGAEPPAGIERDSHFIIAHAFEKWF